MLCFTISVNNLKLLQKVAANDVRRPKLSGIQFVDGFAYATDGHRAYCCPVAMPKDVTGFLPRSRFKDALKGKGIDRTFCIEPSDISDYPQIARLFLKGDTTTITPSWVGKFVKAFNSSFDYGHVEVKPTTITRSLNLEGEWTVGKVFKSEYVGPDFSVCLNCEYASALADFPWDELQVGKTNFQASNSRTGAKMLLMQIDIRDPSATFLAIAMGVAREDF